MLSMYLLPCGSTSLLLIVRICIYSCDMRVMHGLVSQVQTHRFAARAPKELMEEARCAPLATENRLVAGSPAGTPMGTNPMGEKPADAGVPMGVPIRCWNHGVEVEAIEDGVDVIDAVRPEENDEPPPPPVAAAGVMAISSRRTLLASGATSSSELESLK